MRRIWVFILAFVTRLILVSAHKENCADFYWRDYYGTIPDDAIPAGTDSNANQLYIGQAYIKGYELLSATILPKEEIARTSAYSHVLTTDKDVKILCSPHEEAFEWITIESKDLYKYKKRNLVPGGSEVGESLYIGRVFRNNGAIVGKIFRHERDNRGIWFPLETGPTNSLTYDILVYNCEKVKVEVDIRLKD